MSENFTNETDRIEMARKAASLLTTKMERRRFIEVGLGLGVSLAGLATFSSQCGGSSGGGAQSANTPGTTSPGQTTSSSQTGGTDTLIIAAPDTPQTLDSNATVHFPSLEAVHSVYERLLSLKRVKNTDGLYQPDFKNFEPRLAESWDASPDGTVFTFHLRKGVKSNYGNELTADDVKWFWDRSFAVAGVVSFFTGFMQLPNADAVKVVDRYTVQFKTVKPSPLFLLEMADFYLGIFDSTEAKKHATSDDPWVTKWLATNPATYGPYIVEKWAPGEEVIFAARKDYYLGEPKIKRVIRRAVPNSENRMSFLQSGTVDLALDLQYKDLRQLEGKPGVKVDNWKGNYLVEAGMNEARPPFDNKKVRQALLYAMPYKDVLDSVYMGYGQQMKGGVPAIYPSYYGDQFWHYDTDIAKAKALLAEAGYPNGFKTSLIYDAAIPDQEQVAILMQSAFAKIGVELSLQKLPGAVHTEKTSKKDFEMTILRDNPNAPDPLHALFLHYYSKSFLDYVGYTNPEVDSLIDEGLSVMAGDRRDAIAKRLQEITIEDAPWLWIALPGFQVAQRDNIDGVTWWSYGAIRYTDIEKK